MSIMYCDKHGHWDSDFHEQCPICTIPAKPISTTVISGDWLHTKYENGIEVIIPPLITGTSESPEYDYDIDAMQRMANKIQARAVLAKAGAQ